MTPRWAEAATALSRAAARTLVSPKDCQERQERNVAAQPAARAGVGQDWQHFLDLIAIDLRDSQGAHLARLDVALDSERFQKPEWEALASGQGQRATWKRLWNRAAEGPGSREAASARRIGWLLAGLHFPAPIAA